MLNKYHKLKEWLDYKGIEPKDLILITLTFSFLLSVIGLSIYSMLSGFFL